MGLPLQVAAVGVATAVAGGLTALAANAINDTGKLNKTVTIGAAATASVSFVGAAMLFAAAAKATDGVAPAFLGLGAGIVGLGALAFASASLGVDLLGWQQRPGS